jgi:hypothetical protein
MAAEILYASWELLIEVSAKKQAPALPHTNNLSASSTMPVTVDPSSNANEATKPGVKTKSKNQFRRAKNKLKKEQQQNGTETTPKVKVRVVMVTETLILISCMSPGIV